MSRSSRPDDFFQTTTSIEEINRKAAKSHNVSGNPIKLPSKALAICLDIRKHGCVFVAESAGSVRRIDLDVGEIGTSHASLKFDLTDGQTNERSQTYIGPPAPLTSVCLSPDHTELFAGCWDKTVWSWDVATRRSGRRYLGHSDFVKSVISTKLDGKDVLISGGLDAKIIIWDISTGQKLRTIKGHASGVQDLILDPFVSSESSSTVSLFSAGSDREIRCWNDLLGANESSEPMLVHETSVYKLYFDADGDMWTASADGDVKNLIRENGWKSETTLTHPDFVRDVVVDENGGWVVTACRDEEIRVWNRASGELYHTYSGHFEEIMALLLLGSTVVSVGIDATLRRWSLQSDDLRKAKFEAQEVQAGKQIEKEAAMESLLTEEEERELAELMDNE